MCVINIHISTDSGGFEHFNIEKVNFACYPNVTDAFILLISIFEEKLSPAKFEAIRLSCLHRACRCRTLQDKICRTTSIPDLLELLLSHPIYLNWMESTICKPWLLQLEVKCFKIHCNGIEMLCYQKHWEKFGILYHHFIK